MKKLVFSLLLLAILLPATAQESGIRFFHGSWDEAVALAKKEKKKIFIDFFTESFHRLFHGVVRSLPQHGPDGFPVATGR